MPDIVAECVSYIWIETGMPSCVWIHRQSSAVPVWILQEWLWLPGQWPGHLYDSWGSWDCRGRGTKHTYTLPLIQFMTLSHPYIPLLSLSFCFFWTEAELQRNNWRPRKSAEEAYRWKNVLLGISRLCVEEWIWLVLIISQHYRSEKHLAYHNS